MREERARHVRHLGRHVGEPNRLARLLHIDVALEALTLQRRLDERVKVGDAGDGRELAPHALLVAVVAVVATQSPSVETRERVHGRIDRVTGGARTRGASDGAPGWP